MKRAGMWRSRLWLLVVGAGVTSVVAASAGDGTAPEARAALPTVTTPGVEVPSVSTPSVSTPSVSTPGVSAPTGSTPSASAPSVSTPSVRAPSVSAPSVGAPSGSASTGPSSSESAARSSSAPVSGRPSGGGSGSAAPPAGTPGAEPPDDSSSPGAAATSPGYTRPAARRDPAGHGRRPLGPSRARAVRRLQVGTSPRKVRRALHVLRPCVSTLPAPARSLLRWRAGTGAGPPRTLGSLARGLDSSPRQVRARIHRLVGRLRHTALIGGCGAAATARMASDDGSVAAAPDTAAATAVSVAATPNGSTSGAGAGSTDAENGRRTAGPDAARSPSIARRFTAPFSELLGDGGPSLWVVLPLFAAIAVGLVLMMREFRDVLLPAGPPRFTRVARHLWRSARRSMAERTRRRWWS
jgi:hypothetical protein